MSDIARFLDQASASGRLSPFEAAQVYAARDDARAAVEEQRKQVDREAAAEQRLESILLTERAMGQPMAEAARGRQDLAEADEECAELQERLRKAEAKRDRVRSSLEFWANRAQQATVMAARSDAASGVEGAVIRARSMLAAAAEDQRRDVLARARAQQAAWRPGGRHPFVSRGRAVRSDDVPCPDCLAMGATPEESFLIHSDPEPVMPPCEDSADDAGRSAAGSGREITRVTDGAGYGQLGSLTGLAIR